MNTPLRASLNEPLRAATALGLAMALAGPLLYTLLAPMLLQPIVSPTLYSLLGMLFMWLLTGSIVFIIYAWERQSVSSIGLQRLSRKLLILAILLGILLGLAVPVMAFLASRLFPVLPAQTTTPPTNAPAWLVLLGVVTIAITEEVIFRAYILERLQQATGSVWFGAVVSLSVFVLLHVPGWSASHVVGVVLPFGAILTGLYLWQRNLVFVAVTHFLIDFPLFLIAFGVLPQG